MLFRNADHSDVLELELMRRNIPYVKYGGLKFLEAAHVKDLLAVLRWADNPRNRIAAFRVLQLLPGMGPANAQRACEAFEAAGFSWQALAAHRGAGGNARDLGSADAAARQHRSQRTRHGKGRSRACGSGTSRSSSACTRRRTRGAAISTSSSA